MLLFLAFGLWYWGREGLGKSLWAKLLRGVNLKETELGRFFPSYPTRQPG